MWKRMLLMLLCVALALAGIASVKKRQIEAGMAMAKSFAPPPAAVTTVTLESQPWTPSIRVVGTLHAVQGVAVSTDLAGIVSEIAFDSGQSVQKGALLVQLQSDQEKAQLEAADARLHLAELEVQRKRDLRAKNAIPSSEADAAENELLQARAQREQTLALLQRKRICAPFDGVLGIRQASLGQYLNPGSPVVTMDSLDPIRVRFSLPQQQAAQAVIGGSLRISLEDPPPTATTPTTARFWPGSITARDSRVDENSRSLTIEGTLANAEHMLRPGMFVTVEIPLPAESGALVIPASAILYAPYGDSVFVLKDGKNEEGAPVQMVEARIVKLGAARGDQVRVLQGLRAGEEIVSSGVFKLRPDAPVKVNNSVQPPNSAAPTPPNN
jgi:membrane fusion protein (multidrug efflux system)